MGIPMAPAHLALSDLELSNSRSPRFGSVISRKGTLKLGRMLLLNINRKPYTVSPMVSSHSPVSDLEKSNSRSMRLWVVGELYGIHIFASGLLCHLDLDVTKENFVCGRLFPLSQRSVLFIFICFIPPSTVFHICEVYASPFAAMLKFQSAIFSHYPIPVTGYFETSALNVPPNDL